MSERVDDGRAAFPVAAAVTTDGEIVANAAPGMSLRDWFAGQALAGMLANGQGPDLPWLHGSLLAVGEHAYVLADAMIAAHKKVQP